jgi:pSer/pThr/pTyr-binding forkhead associated (FHA) protein
LRQVGEQAGVEFYAAPVVLLAADPALALQAVQVSARIQTGQLTPTMGLELPDLGGEPSPPNAYLVVDGTQLFPLRSSVINIGRRADNDLVIDDARISRRHAQIRQIRGRFVLFDLDSTGGSFINNQRIRQGALRPGDVIALAGVPLVFGQDPARVDSTQYLPPAAPADP